MARPVGSGRTALRKRLLSRIEVTTVGCWEFTGARNEKGYGHIGLGGKGRTTGAHRASWLVHNGPIPEGLHVLHRCDNPPCVNPKHLFLGTNADNHDDKIAKGRAKGAPGESHPFHRLTEADVREIRRLYEIGAGTTRALGAQFGVSCVCIFNIIHRRTWSHVA